MSHPCWFNKNHRSWTTNSNKVRWDAIRSCLLRAGSHRGDSSGESAAWQVASRFVQWNRLNRSDSSRSDLEKGSCTTLGATSIDINTEVILQVVWEFVLKSPCRVAPPLCEPALKSLMRISGHNNIIKNLYCTNSLRRTYNIKRETVVPLSILFTFYILCIQQGLNTGLSLEPPWKQPPLPFFFFPPFPLLQVWPLLPSLCTLHACIPTYTHLVPRLVHLWCMPY